MPLHLSNKAEVRVNELIQKHGRDFFHGNVIEDAKNKDSPLHDLFEWDITIAAQKHWEDTARNIVSLVEIRVTNKKVEYTSVRYVRDPSKPGNEAGYVDLERVREDETWSIEVLASEIKKATYLLNRVMEIASVLGLEMMATKSLVDSIEESTNLIKSKRNQRAISITIEE